MNNYRVIYYTTESGTNPIKNFIDSLSPQQQTKILRIFQYITEYGLPAVLPHIKKVTGTSLWEIRILGKDNIRLFYVVIEKTDVLILHGCIKKTQKTKKKDITLALDRYTKWKE